ncbi:MAG: RNA polymerase subunit sigma-70 [Blastopirellula sp.]|nr:RNA polymerase subunit sigma-70 [Blastopirellula sp.]
MAEASNSAESREDFTQRWLQAEPSVSAYIFATIHRFHDAEDVLQQVAQQAASRFDQYDSSRPFLGWVLWLAKSRIIDFYRRRDRDRLVLDDTFLDRLSEAFVERAASRCERREALEACLQSLPERSRELLDLRYVEDLPATAIADSLGSTAGSIRVQLTRVRHALAECIQRRIALGNA